MSKELSDEKATQKLLEEHYEKIMDMVNRIYVLEYEKINSDPEIRELANHVFMLMLNLKLKIFNKNPCR